MEKVSLKKYLEKIIELNDRRYNEVNSEREKALKIKEKADEVALGLAREIQKYKDEKANELREQINKERNLYVTEDKLATMLKPVFDFISTHQGKNAGFGSAKDYILTGLTVILGLIVIYRFFIK